MKMRKNLYPICLAAFLLCLFEVPVWAGRSKSTTATPEGWPERVGQRKLYPSEYGFVYAGSKSSVGKMNKIIRTVVKDLEKENVKPGTKGLILVMGKKEEPPFEAKELLTMFAQQQSKEKEGQDLEKALEALEDGKKEMEELGLDMNLLLSITPLPIVPNMLPDLIKGFPKDMDQQIDWCTVIPTESNIKYGMKKMISAGLKKEKVGIVEQVALFPILAFAENKAIGELKKARRIALFGFLVDKQEHLTKEQKEAIQKAYMERL